MGLEREPIRLTLARPGPLCASNSAGTCIRRITDEGGPALNLQRLTMTVTAVIALLAPAAVLGQDALWIDDGY